jgi:hypothetical protein
MLRAPKTVICAIIKKVLKVMMAELGKVCSV